MIPVTVFKGYSGNWSFESEVSDENVYKLGKMEEKNEIVKQNEGKARANVSFNPGMIGCTQS